LTGESEAKTRINIKVVVISGNGGGGGGGKMMTCTNVFDWRGFKSTSVYQIT